MESSGGFRFSGHARAFTFLEIVIAMGVIAVALIPIFGVIHKGAEETDLNASQAFAINKGSEILNALLDNVPVEAIRAGNPAVMKTSDLSGVKDYTKYDAVWCKKMAEMLFPDCPDTSGGYSCKGIVTDPRGVSYAVTLKVEDVCASPAPADAKPETTTPPKAPTDFPELREMSFSFLRNPAKISSSKWTQQYNPNPTGGSLAGFPRWETECVPNNVSESPDSIYTDDNYTGFSADAPRFVNPSGVRFTQRMVAEKVNYTSDDSFAYCTMKKLIIEVQWNSDRSLYSQPEKEGVGIKRVHLMTLKGDLSR